MEATRFSREAEFHEREIDRGMETLEAFIWRLEPDPEDTRSAKMWETPDVAEPTTGRRRGAS